MRRGPWQDDIVVGSSNFGETTMDKLRTRVGDGAARLVSMVQVDWAGLTAPRSDAERGQGLAEYALILSLIALAVITALAFFGTQLQAVLLDPIAADIGDVVKGQP
jgi:Flp pilus assembly pilin Flp